MDTSPVRALCMVVGLVLANSVLAQSTDLEPISVPRFTHPGAGQTFYFVLTDRFANGSTANDTGGYPGGTEDHGFDPTRISHYHGGDFVGLTAQLDYLRKLGTTAVWVTPPFKNKPVQAGTAGYHGYWVTDFLAVDPHLGTNEEYHAFVAQTHARGMRVYMDIITNHSADVISNKSGKYDYVPRADSPYRDAVGKPFDERTVAFNGLNDPAAFPELSAEVSFPYVPVVPEVERNVKNPGWLNDVIYYHHRGNTRFVGENSILGDFVGLDDLFTEHPRVVEGFIDIFSQWLELGVDGFRIDTVRHVNNEFWHAFVPAIRARARELGRPDFLQFAEVYNEAGDSAVLSEFSTHVPIDTTIDFGFFVAARNFVSRGGSAVEFAGFIDRDDYYTDHDSNVHSTTTFLGNHDAGRFGYFLQQDNPESSLDEIAALSRLGHGLLYLSRGQPVIYYGDEQGMVGRGGNDQQARESMFASQAPAFATAPLLATTRTGADDKFDEQHPFFQLFSRLGSLRAAHSALRTGAMIPRLTEEPSLLAFSRIDRGELVEYLVAFNNSRTESLSANVPTSQQHGSSLLGIFASDATAIGTGERLVADQHGHVCVKLAPMEFAVWRADSSLSPANAPSITLAGFADGEELSFSTREVDGLDFPSRLEISADVSGGDGIAEVTFAMRRSSRPDQLEWLGTDDAPPYRIFWRPPPDLAAGEHLTFIASVDDLRGHQVASEVRGVTVAYGGPAFGIRGAKTPLITTSPASAMNAKAGEAISLFVRAEGTGPLEYQWLRDGAEIPGATQDTLRLTASGATAGSYRVLVRNRAGTTISAPAEITVDGTSARIEKHPVFPSQFVAPRQVDVWLPPGYDANDASRYPVIYMHDGQNLFDPATSYTGVPWGVDDAMRRLIATGRTPGAIIVGIWNTGITRFAEYMPQKPMTADVLSGYGENIRVALDELQSDAYLRFLVTELKPFADRTYRTKPDAAHTFIMGSSMGGLISAYALVEYPEVFGGAGSVSTHWPAGDGGVIDYVARRLPPPGTARLYFDHGTGTLDGSYEAYQHRMDELLRAAGWVEGRDWMTRRFPGAEHSERFWRDRVDIPLAFLLGATD